MLSFYMIFFVCLATYTVNASNDDKPVNPSGLRKPQKPGNGSVGTTDGGLFGVENMIENKRKGKTVGNNNVIDDIKMDGKLDKTKATPSVLTTNWSDNLEKHQNVASDSSEESAESNESSQSDSSESEEKLNTFNKQGKGNFQHFPTNPQQNLNEYNRYDMADGRYGNMYGNKNYGYNDERYPQPHGPQHPPPRHFGSYQQSFGGPPPPPPPPPRSPFTNNFPSYRSSPPPPMQSNGWYNRNSYGSSWQDTGDLRNQENIKSFNGNQRIRPNNIMMDGNKSKFDQNQKQAPPNSRMQPYNSINRNTPYNGHNNYDNDNYFTGNGMNSRQEHWTNGLNNHSNNQPKKNQYPNNQDKNTINQYGDLVGPLTSKGHGGVVNSNDNGIKPNEKKLTGVKANEGINYLKETGNHILENNLNHGQGFTASGNKSRKNTNPNQKTNEMDQYGNLNSLKTNNNNNTYSNKPGSNKPATGGVPYGKMYHDEELPGDVTGMGNIAGKSGKGIKTGGPNGIEMSKNGIRLNGPNGGITVGA